MVTTATEAIDNSDLTLPKKPQTFSVAPVMSLAAANTSGAKKAKAMAAKTIISCEVETP
jgi:hypothetical protein